MVKCQDCGLLILRAKAVPFEQVVVDPYTRDTGEIVFPDVSETPYCQRGVGIDGEFWGLYKQLKDQYDTTRLMVFTKDRPCPHWQANRGAYTAKEQDEMSARELAQRALDKIASSDRWESTRFWIGFTATNLIAIGSAIAAFLAAKWYG